jgi:hypothetical protein
LSQPPERSPSPPACARTSSVPWPSTLTCRAGSGSLIVQEHCHRLDRAHEVGYLETDKRENVRFYERFGFAVMAEEPVIGVPNWFKRREPRSAGS